MHKATVVVCIILGVLEVIGTAYWSLIAMAFGAFERNGIPILILLLAGPLSLLPAGFVGRKRPFAAGVWLVLGANFCFHWHLGVLMGGGYHLLTQSFERWLPVVLICTPMLLTGIPFLWVGRQKPLETLSRWWASPVFRRRIGIAGATLAACGTVVFGVWKFMEPSWVITVTPEGQPSRSIRFNPKDHQTPDEGPEKYLRLEAELKALFTPLFKTSDRTTLGESVWTGSSAGGTSTWSVERDGKGLVRVLQNGTPVDQNWLYPGPTMDWAVRAEVSRILTQAWREHPPPPPRY